MEDKRNHEILERLNQYIADYNDRHNGEGGQAYVGKQLGYSPSVITQYIKGIYATPHKVESKLKAWFDTCDAAQTQYVMPEYLPTSMSESIYQSIRNAHLTNSIIIEQGDSGIGKTKTALKYAADYPQSTIMFSINPCNHTHRGVLRELCRSFGISPKGVGQDMYNDIAGRLIGRKMIIIDEAQFLTVTAIETLRSLWDLPTTEFGLVLIGNHTIVGNLNGRNAAQYAQLNNRITRRPVRFAQDIKRSDIHILFPEIDDNKSVELLLAIARSNEGVRNACKVFVGAKNNGNTTYAGLYAMAKDMRIELVYH